METTTSVHGRLLSHRSDLIIIIAIATYHTPSFNGETVGTNSIMIFTQLKNIRILANKANRQLKPYFQNFKCLPRPAYTYMCSKCVCLLENINNFIKRKKPTPLVPLKNKLIRPASKLKLDSSSSYVMTKRKLFIAHIH